MEIVKFVIVFLLFKHLCFVACAVESKTSKCEKFVEKYSGVNVSLLLGVEGFTKPMKEMSKVKTKLSYLKQKGLMCGNYVVKGSLKAVKKYGVKKFFKVFGQFVKQDNFKATLVKTVVRNIGNSYVSLKEITIPTSLKKTSYVKCKNGDRIKIMYESDIINDKRCAKRCASNNRMNGICKCWAKKGRSVLPLRVCTTNKQVCSMLFEDFSFNDLKLVGEEKHCVDYDLFDYSQKAKSETYEQSVEVVNDREVKEKFSVIDTLPFDFDFTTFMKVDVNKLDDGAFIFGILVIVEAVLMFLRYSETISHKINVLLFIVVLLVQTTLCYSIFGLFGAIFNGVLMLTIVLDKKFKDLGVFADFFGSMLFGFILVFAKYFSSDKWSNVSVTLVVFSIFWVICRILLYPGKGSRAASLLKLFFTVSYFTSFLVKTIVVETGGVGSLLVRYVNMLRVVLFEETTLLSGVALIVRDIVINVLAKCGAIEFEIMSFKILVIVSTLLAYFGIFVVTGALLRFHITVSKQEEEDVVALALLNGYLPDVLGMYVSGKTKSKGFDFGLKLLLTTGVPFILCFFNLDYGFVVLVMWYFREPTKVLKFSKNMRDVGLSEAKEKIIKESAVVFRNLKDTGLCSAGAFGKMLLTVGHSGIVAGDKLIVSGKEFFVKNVKVLKRFKEYNDSIIQVTLDKMINELPWPEFTDKPSEQIWTFTKQHGTLYSPTKWYKQGNILYNSTGNISGDSGNVYWTVDKGKLKVMGLHFASTVEEDDQAVALCLNSKKLVTNSKAGVKLAGKSIKELESKLGGFEKKVKLLVEKVLNFKTNTHSNALALDLMKKELSDLKEKRQVVKEVKDKKFVDLIKEKLKNGKEIHINVGAQKKVVPKNAETFVKTYFGIINGNLENVVKSGKELGVSETYLNKLNGQNSWSRLDSTEVKRLLVMLLDKRESYKEGSDETEFQNLLQEFKLNLIE